MQNNINQQKHPRGSSPNQEIEQGFDNREQKLFPVEQVPERLLTTVYGIEQLKKNK